MKIVSLNIWDVPIWYVEKRKERYTASARYFRSLDADIVCIQESFNPANRDFLHRELGSAYHTTDTVLASRRFLFLPFDVTGGLVVFSKFPVLSSEFIPFSRLVNVSPPEFFARKGVLIVRLSTPYGELRVMNLHLHMQSPFLSRRVRLHQLAHALESISENDTVPTLLMGDFNEDSLHRDEDFARLLRAKGFTHLEAHAAGLSYRPDNPFVQGHLFNRTSVPKRYDFIFYRCLESAHLVPAKGGVLHPPSPLSDHEPILLELEKV